MGRVGIVGDVSRKEYWILEEVAGELKVRNATDGVDLLRLPIELVAYVPVPDSPQTGLPADSTGVKWTSAFKHKWSKGHLKAVRIRATWTASATDSVTKIAVRDVSTGADVVAVSGNAATDAEAETTDLTNVTDGGLFEVYAEVTTASATSGATFDIVYVTVELVYGGA